MHTSISPVTFVRVCAVVERLASDVQDTFTLVEHVRALGLPPEESADLKKALADALGQGNPAFDAAHYTPDAYLNAMHTVWGFEHDALITMLRNWLREHDPRDSDDDGEDGFIARHGYGRARRQTKVGVPEVWS